MSTPNPVLSPTPGAGGLSVWIRYRRHWLLSLVAAAAIVAVVALVAAPSATAPPVPGEVVADDRRYASPVRTSERASLIDHSVIESKSLLDEPDMTGASIGAYAP
jgi:hypothetical protein